MAIARENYYTSAGHIRGEWHGQLARQWGLAGAVDEQHFQRLAEGQDPWTGEQIVRHRAVCAYTNDRGQPVKTMAHRAGWDATFSAPKSVSLTALVGGDARVRDAHRESVGVALDELERYVQARLGDHPAQATGQWVAAQFEHDSARPVDGYAAPQLHTHAVVFNLTRTENGDIRPLQPRELYKPLRTLWFCSPLVWKWELQQLANRTGLAITVCHFPPGTSKWNKIEHRLFSHIAMNWRGTSLVDLATIVSLIGSTHSRSGLRVRSELDRGTYPGGVTVTDAQLATIHLERHRTIRFTPPRHQPDKSVVR